MGDLTVISEREKCKRKDWADSLHQIGGIFVVFGVLMFFTGSVAGCILGAVILVWGVAIVAFRQYLSSLVLYEEPRFLSYRGIRIWALISVGLLAIGAVAVCQYRNVGYAFMCLGLVSAVGTVKDWIGRHRMGS